MNLYTLLRPLLFSLDAEKSHELCLKTLQNLQKKPALLSALLGQGDIKTSPTQLMGLNFPNQVGLAAGLDKNAQCVSAFAAMGFGFIETGTVTPKPQQGNDLPRLFRLKSEQAIINRMGFNSVGIEQYIKNIQSYRDQTNSKSNKSSATIIGLNIGKNAITDIANAVDDYLIGFQKAYQYADYISVNISSPNTKNLRDLQHGESLSKLLNRLKKEQEILVKEHNKYVPFVVKIAPDNTSEALQETAKICINEGVDGIIATNTTLGRNIDHPLREETGGLSGKPLTKLALQTVEQLASTTQNKIPLIAAGGIMSGQDARDKINAGASLVQIYTGFIYQGPKLIKEILEELNK